MNKLKLVKEEILSSVKAIPELSFVELEGILESKNLVQKLDNDDVVIIRLPKYNELVLWITSNNLLAVAVGDLLYEKKLLAKPCSIWIYAMDGRSLKLPIAQKICHYKTDHWIPVVFSIRGESQ